MGASGAIFWSIWDIESDEKSPDEHHDHLIDVNSGEIIEFTNEEIEKLQKQVARKLGYKLVDHKLELYGTKIKD